MKCAVIASQVKGGDSSYITTSSNGSLPNLSLSLSLSLSHSLSIIIIWKKGKGRKVDVGSSNSHLVNPGPVVVTNNTRPYSLTILYPKIFLLVIEGEREKLRKIYVVTRSCGVNPINS